MVTHRSTNSFISPTFVTHNHSTTAPTGSASKGPDNSLYKTLGSDHAGAEVFHSLLTNNQRHTNAPSHDLLLLLINTYATSDLAIEMDPSRRLDSGKRRRARKIVTRSIGSRLDKRDRERADTDPASAAAFAVSSDSEDGGVPLQVSVM